MLVGKEGARRVRRAETLRRAAGGWSTGREMRARSSGRQEVVDRPIWRAERMALVLRITRFIGTTLKPAWHARCHPSPCAGLGIFSTGIARLSPVSAVLRQ
jgi:hypothetical protein